MNLKRYQSLLANLSARARLTGAIAVLLAIANILLVGKVVSMEDDSRTLFLPATVREGFWVQGDAVSPSYLEDLALTVSSLALTYNASNFRARTQRLLRYVAPASHAELESRFMEEADHVARYRIASVFHVQSTVTRGMKVALLGQLERRTGNKSMEVRRTAYLAEFRNVGGTIFLTGFKEVDYDDPFMDRHQPADTADDA